jgi:hypothetical protein
MSLGAMNKNPKSQIPNNKQYQNSNDQNSKQNKDPFRMQNGQRQGRCTPKTTKKE